MKLHSIATLLMLMPGMAMAALDRGGNALEGGGIGAANLIAACVVALGVGWATKAFMDSTGRYTEETTAMVAIIAALVVSPILSYFMFS